MLCEWPYCRPTCRYKFKSGVYFYFKPTMYGLKFCRFLLKCQKFKLWLYWQDQTWQTLTEIFKKIEGAGWKTCQLNSDCTPLLETYSNLLLCIFWSLQLTTKQIEDQTNVLWMKRFNAVKEVEGERSVLFVIHQKLSRQGWHHMFRNSELYCHVKEEGRKKTYFLAQFFWTCMHVFHRCTKKK